MFNWFKAPEIAQSQYRLGGRKDRMLKFLQAREWKEIWLNVILHNFRDIADPTRTIRYLEADGYHIENKTKRNKDHSVYSTYTYLGYDLFFKKCPKKRTKREEEIYEEWFQACMTIYWLK